jgi:hypothetical protein
MKVNKIVALAGLVLSLSAGVAEAAVLNASAAIGGTVVGTPISCAFTNATPLSIPAASISNLTETRVPFSTSVTCNTSTNYSIAFAGTGQLTGAACTLSYRISNYVPANTSYDTVNLLTTTSAAIGANANAASIASFGLVIPANQSTCPVVGNTPIGVTGTLTMNVNY